MAIGFVLLTTLPGMEASVREALSDVDLVTDHWMLFGEYDLIARVPVSYTHLTLPTMQVV